MGICHFAGELKSSFVSRILSYADETDDQARLALRLFKEYCDGDAQKMVSLARAIKQADKSPESVGKTFEFIAHLAEGKLPDGTNLPVDSFVAICRRAG